MLNLVPEGGSSRPLNILCIGCHSDDIEIGCGATLLRLAHAYPNATFHWVVMSAIGPREAEARRAASLFISPKQLKNPILKTFADGFMPFNGAEVKAVFEELKPIAPDVVFCHYRKDAHQDHRLSSELTWNTFRNHLILEYEIPKWDGDMGQPNVFVPVTKEVCEQKIEHLMDAFGTQRSKRWFEPETFRSLMRLRGMECNAPSGYAEAFYARKILL
jgi:LmbE family N-acetylglucosaminyl deacetylase